MSNIINELDQEFIEPLIDPKNERFTMHPITYPKIWEMYKKQQNAYWRAEEIDFERDADDFATLNEDEQQFIKMILAFFAASDGIVNFNLRERFGNEIKIMEALTVYGWQQMMESIHSEVYSLMLDNIVKDPKERKTLYNAISSVPSIKLMADWAFKWIESADTIAHRIIAFACVEGIFFSGAFAAIFWLKKERSKGKLFMNGLVKSNQLISRDEGLHVKFACMLYEFIVNKLELSVVHDIVNDAVSIAKIFVRDAIRCDMIGMNLDLMNEYIEYVADTILVMLDCEKLYNTDNPFDFMENIAMDNKTDFFGSRPTEYQYSYNESNKAKERITIVEDF